MKVFVANLKHFYQCRNLWGWYLILLLPSMLIASLMFYFTHLLSLKSRALPSLASMSQILPIFLVPGLLVADIQRNVLTKPFSFCLPGHKNVPKRLIFGIGGTINLLFGIIFLGSLELEYQNIFLTPLAISCAGMIFYLLGAWLVFLSKRMSYMTTFFFIWFSLVSSGYRESLEDILVSSPLLLIAAGVLVCGISWIWLGRESLAREYAGRMLVGLADGWNPARRKRYLQKKALQTASRGDSGVFIDRLENLFLSGMKKYSSFDKNRYILGNSYIVCNRFFGSRWIIQLFLLMGTFLFVGYFPDGRMLHYLFIVPVFYACQLDLIPHRKLLLPGGRTERFYGALGFGFVITILSTLLVAAGAVLSEPLSTILPDIIWKGKIYVFYPMDLREFYLCLFFMPMALIAGTIFRNNLLARFAVVVVAMGSVLMGTISEEGMTILSLIGLPGVLALIVVSWIGFLVIMRYHCRKRSLVGQGK